MVIIFECDYSRILRKYREKNWILIKDPLSEDTIEKYEDIIRKDKDRIISVFIRSNINKSVLEKLKELGVKKIITRSIGTDHIDLETAKKLGIVVENIIYDTDVVAEHAWALLLSFAKKINNKFKNWFCDENLRGIKIKEKTIGILGLGRIGSKIARIALAFECKVLGYDIIEKEELKNIGVVYTTLENVLKESEIIFISLPLTKNTYHLLNEDKLRIVKNGCIIVNISRGGIVDENALKKIKKEKRIYYLTDVFEKEPPEDSSFVDLYTPHIGWFTKETEEEIVKKLIEKLFMN